MDISDLLDIVGDEPVFETGMLLAGNVDPSDVRRQLSRWKKAGRIWQLRRGVYALAPPLQKTKPHPFLVANRLVRGSYVSLQSALAHHGLIPEYVPVVTSVTARRPGCWETPLGTFVFRHVKVSLLTGYRLAKVSPGQEAFLAGPEKALLDLVHLEPGGDSEEYLAELRLQGLASLDMAELTRQAEASGSRKLRRTASIVTRLGETEREDYGRP